MKKLNYKQAKTLYESANKATDHQARTILAMRSWRKYRNKMWQIWWRQSNLFFFFHPMSYVMGAWNIGEEILGFVRISVMGRYLAFIGAIALATTFPTYQAIENYKQTEELRIDNAANTLLQAQIYIQNSKEKFNELPAIMIGTPFNLVGAIETLHKADRELASMQLPYSYLDFINLQGALMAMGDFQKASLKFANLRGANLSGSNLQEADLSNADLQGSALVYVNFQKANLRKTNLKDADVSDSIFLQVKELRKEQILQAEWTDFIGFGPPTLPKYITHPNGVEDPDIADWLAKPYNTQ